MLVPLHLVCDDCHSEEDQPQYQKCPAEPAFREDEQKAQNYHQDAGVHQCGPLEVSIPLLFVIGVVILRLWFLRMLLILVCLQRLQMYVL